MHPCYEHRLVSNTSATLLPILSEGLMGLLPAEFQMGRTNRGMKQKKQQYLVVMMKPCHCNTSQKERQDTNDGGDQLQDLFTRNARS